MIETRSGVNKEGKPFVGVRWGKEKGQFTPDETRVFALTLLEAAEAAESDAQFWEFAGSVLGEAPKDLERRPAIFALWRRSREAAHQKGEAEATSPALEP